MNHDLALLVALAASTASVGCSDSIATEPERAAPVMASRDQAPHPTGPRADYVNTPSGLYHKTCVHEIPAGGSVASDGSIVLPNGNVITIPPCQFKNYPNWGPNRANFPGIPTANGWIENAQAQLDSSQFTDLGFSEIDATVIVPPNPASWTNDNNHTLFLFPGLTSRPAPGAKVIQPVLQYGKNGVWGGTFWTMAGWSCDAGTHCYYGSHPTVYAGDSITTTVLDWNYPTCAYYPANCQSIWFTDQTHSASATVVFNDTLAYVNAHAGVIEVYGLTSCSEFPSGGARFRDVQLQEASLSQPKNVIESSYYSVYVTNPTWAHNIGAPSSG
jgi:hypothetical protein